MPKRAENSGKPLGSPVQVDLALQGGGSHGAFTWGVLDRLLEEPWLKIEAISGTSAGAMNARGAGQRLHAGRRRRRARGARRLLGPGRGGGAVQPAPALAARPADEPLDARHLAGLSRDGPDVAGGLALQPQSARPQSDQRHPREEHRFRPSRRGARSSSSSPRPTCTPGAGAFSATRRSRPTCCSPRPACRRCSRRSRSTASPIGTAASSATRPSRRWCARATRST